MKNKLMRAATLLLVLTLMTSCFVGSTFAKYTTSVTSEDSARVAKWGFTQTAIDIDDLFVSAYDIGAGDQTVVAAADAIAPGTGNSASFQFVFGGQTGIDAPEVDYTFTVEVDDTCADSIKNNKNIKWSLTQTENAVDTVLVDEGTWSDLVAKLESLDGDVAKYEANHLPNHFNKNNPTYTIEWVWEFGDGSSTLVYDTNADLTPDITQDQYDTMMGNDTTLDECSIEITITATQVN